MLGFVSGFINSEDIYTVTNFYVVETAYDIKLGLEEQNTDSVEFVSNVTD